MEQYQYVEGFLRLHSGLRLRCAACLSLQVFVLFEYIHYDIQYSFCIPNEKVVQQPRGLYSKRARLNATKSVLVIYLCIRATHKTATTITQNNVLCEVNTCFHDPYAGFSDSATYLRLLWRGGGKCQL